MSQKKNRSVRKQVRKEAAAVTAYVFQEIMKWPLKERIKLSYRIIFRKFRVAK